MTRLRFLDALSILAVVWASCAFIPLQWLWYSPGAMFVPDYVSGDDPEMGVSRKVHRDVKMSYNVLVKSVKNLQTVCENASGVFTYRAEATLPDPLSLSWWVDHDKGCMNLPEGSYIMETCWTAPNRWWGILPAKTVCVDSNVFHVSAKR